MPDINQEFVTKTAKEIVAYAKGNCRSNKKENSFPNWYAGITNDHEVRIVGHTQRAKVEELDHFKPFYAHTFANARAIENHLCEWYDFSHCKSLGKPNTDEHKSPSNWVYVYLLPTHLR